MLNVAIIGNRKPCPACASFAKQTVLSCVQQQNIQGNITLSTGCANGIDLIVRQNSSPTVHSISSNTKIPIAARLAQRSSALMQASNLILAFPCKPCPPGIRFPQRKWQSGHGSGTWASLALAAGLNKTIAVYTCPECPAMPYWGGKWSTISMFTNSFWVYVNPQKKQQYLFS